MLNCFQIRPCIILLQVSKGCTSLSICESNLSALHVNFVSFFPLYKLSAFELNFYSLLLGSFLSLINKNKKIFVNFKKQILYHKY